MKSNSFTVGADLVRGPQRYLNDVLSQGNGTNLLEGIVMAGTFLEHYGKDKLEKYYISKQVPTKPLNIKQMFVGKVYYYLHAFGLIDDPFFKDFTEFIAVRNDVVHNLDYPDSVLFAGKMNAAQLRDAIEKAKRCLVKMGAP